MEDEEALALLSEMVQSVRRTTANEKPSFYNRYVAFATDLNRISRHVDNDGLRETYFHMSSLEGPLREAWNYQLQSRIVDSIRYMDDESERKREIAMDAATSISIRVFSEIDGRSTIDFDQLQKELDGTGENLPPSIFIIAKAVRENYEVLVEEYSTDIIEFYGDLQQECNNSWHDIHRRITEETVEKDKQAIAWRRSIEEDDL